MLRSLYSAVSGVKSHQTYLDVTGNNIANVNTVGFKRDSLQFRDMIYQDSRSASAPNAGVPIGGINPAQVGLGVQVGSIETVHTGGSLQNTGVPTDMAISGKGFFVVQNGSQQLYTRAGNFSLDRDGNLVMSGNGYMVQGYAYKNQYNAATGAMERVKDTNLSGINIPLGEKIPAKATSVASFRCNLCSTATPAVADVNNIPGGSSKVQRPHTYSAQGATAVNYVGTDTTEVAAPVEGMTYFNTTDNTLYKYSDGAWAATAKDSEAYYYGANSATAAVTNYVSSFSNADGSETGLYAKLSSIAFDFTGAGDPATTTTAATAAGQKYLDTTNGRIYTSQSDGSGGFEWSTTTTTMSAGTAYGVRGATDVYVLDATGVPTTVADTILNESDKKLYTWDDTSNTWVEQAYSSAGFKAGETSVTDQATIDAFGKSMIAKHDWETKSYVYDSLGNAYTLVTTFRKVAEYPADPTGNPPTSAEAEWDWYSYYVDDKGKVMEQYGEGAGTLVFGADGLLKRTYYYEPTPATPTTNATSSTQPEYNWSVVEKIIDETDPRYNASVHDSLSTGKVVADFNVAGAEGSVVDGIPQTYASNMIIMDFLGKEYAAAMGTENEPIQGVTQYGSPFTTKVHYQNGYPMGELNDWSVGGDGIIMGSYTNGRSLPIAQVALATFANEAGLSKVGNTCFAATANSGEAQIGEPMVGSAGSVVGNTIEMSNVDLSEEFVNLIRAQRGFQANSRVVTTSDQVLEELINLKR